MEPHRIVRASAGSGKTHRLANRYIELLLSGASAENMLAATFTKKAAGQILARILCQVAEAAASGSHARRLGEEIGRPSLRRGDCQRLLVVLCSSLHRISVSTLDGFFYRVACMLRFELGLRTVPRMTTIDDPLERARRHEALESALDKIAKESFSDLLELVRRLQGDVAGQSVALSLDALLVELHEVWGQASEKRLWECLELPDAVSEKRLEEAVTALERLARGSPPGALRKALESNLAQARRQAWRALLKSGLTAKLAQAPCEPAYSRKPIPSNWIEPLGILVDHARRTCLERVRQQTEATFRFLGAFDSAYRELCRREGVLLFSDLPREIHKQLSTADDSLLPEIFYRLDGKVSHLLLDEFQDTSLDQWSILRPIAEEICSYGDGSHTFFCVGDPKQAIYGWRGGCSDLFSQLELDLALPSSEEEGLNGSYRSSQAVLDVVNRVFLGLEHASCLDEQRTVVDRWTAGFEDHFAHRRRPGYVELRESEVREGVSHESWVAGEIEGLRRLLPRHSLAVLVQTNDQVGRILEELRRRALAASGEGGTRVDDDPAVAALQAALILADHPGDTIAAFHVWSTPLAPIVGLDSLEPETTARVARRIRQSWQDLGPQGLLGSWIGALGPACDERNIRRLQQVLDLLQGSVSSDLERPGDLVRYLGRARVQDASSEGIRVMTIHKAKGLEFDSVVLAELDRPLLGLQTDALMISRESPMAPVKAVYRAAGRVVREASPQLEAAYREEGERRLRDDLSALYVAMTRARSALFLWPRASRKRSGKKGQSVRASFARILHETLGTDARPDTGLGDPIFRHGDLEILARSMKTDTAGDRQQTLQLEPPQPKPRSHGPSSVEKAGSGRRRVFVRAEEAGAPTRARVEDLTLGDSEDMRSRRRRFLAWVDGLDLGSPERPTSGDLEASLRGVLDDPEWQRFVAAVRRNAGTVECWRRRAFVDLTDENVVSGTFERAWIARNGAEVTTVSILESGAIPAELLRSVAARQLGLAADRVCVLIVRLDRGDCQLLGSAGGPQRQSS